MPDKVFTLHDIAVGILRQEFRTQRSRRSALSAVDLWHSITGRSLMEAKSVIFAVGQELGIYAQGHFTTCPTCKGFPLSAKACWTCKGARVVWAEAQWSSTWRTFQDVENEALTNQQITETT